MSNGFESRPTETLPRPWKPIAIIAGAVVLVVLVIIGAMAMVRSRQASQIEELSIERVEADLDRAIAGCEQEKNPESCVEEKVTTAATSFGFQEICAKLGGVSYDNCVWSVARMKNDPKICQEVKDEALMARCSDNVWYRLAKANVSKEDCEQIQEASLQTACTDAVKIAIAAEQGCEAVYEGSFCESRELLDSVLASKDPELCQTIPHPDVAAECIEGIGVGDPDLDGIDSVQEEKLGTDPRNPDTDGDGYSDGEEVAAGYNPVGTGAVE